VVRRSGLPPLGLTLVILTGMLVMFATLLLLAISTGERQPIEGCRLGNAAGNRHWNKPRRLTMTSEADLSSNL
jgi:hypothetical protein